MKISFTFYRPLVIILMFFVASCVSSQKAFNNGDYDKAVYKSVNSLQRKSNNPKEAETLKRAYSSAIETHQKNIEEAKLSDNVLRWEVIIQEYAALNNLTAEIRKCPACLSVVSISDKYITELADAKLKAADVRYARGIKLLAERNRESAKQAYEDFGRAEQLSPGYKDAKAKIEDAYFAAILKIVVEPAEVNRGTYELSNEYFQTKIMEYLEKYENRTFMKFYSTTDAKSQGLVPDQVLTFKFDDFVVGQTYTKEKIEEVSRDSVKLGTSKAGVAYYGTVKAKVSVFEKTVTSSGILDFRVKDWRTKDIITQEKMPGTYVWQEKWGSYQGDERALPANYVQIVKKKESYPPGPQFLFIEFTKPILAQVTSKIKSFYSKY